MIIVQLKGGLGNQLFQYAAGLSLALHHSVPVKVDTTELKRPDDKIGTTRNFDLQNLIAPPIVASTQEIDEFVKKSLLEKYLEKTLAPHKRKIFKEASFQFDPHFFQAGSHIYLKGYRQSEKYFKRFEGILRETLVLQPNLTEHLSDFAKTMRDANSVSIHIRRGDYSKKIVEDYHGILDEDYYQRAINKVSQLIENPVFYIFTDNASWVQENIKILNATIVSESITKTHLEDFYLMSQCRHNIIANSSFSWWAAWLNTNEDKIVVAPSNWFNSAGLSTEDLIPNEWISV